MKNGNGNKNGNGKPKGLPPPMRTALLAEIAEEASQRVIGRPTKKTGVLIDELCERMERGVSATKACEQVGIAWSAMCRWLNEDPAFQDRYRAAREIQADLYAEQMMDIAEEDPQLVFQNIKGGNEEKAGETIIRVDGSCVQHQKLRIETRRWFAAVIKPHKYGPRVQQQQLDRSGNPTDPTTLTINLSVGIQTPGGK